MYFYLTFKIKQALKQENANVNFYWLYSDSPLTLFWLSTDSILPLFWLSTDFYWVWLTIYLLSTDLYWFFHPCREALSQEEKRRRNVKCNMGSNIIFRFWSDVNKEKHHFFAFGCMLVMISNMFDMVNTKIKVLYGRIKKDHKTCHPERQYFSC